MDIEYQKQNRVFTVDRERFPDFPGMIVQLKSKNFHAVVITDLHLANLPGHGYSPYDTAIAGDHFLKNPDASVYSRDVRQGPSVFPAFTSAQTGDWWGPPYRAFLTIGFASF